MEVDVTFEPSASNLRNRTSFADRKLPATLTSVKWRLARRPPRLC